MTLQYTRHERVFLRSLPAFSEAWLHERICEDTTILGLGELDVIDKERSQYSGGRLDVLLTDAENSVRYEFEVMLGATDPSHIIRRIEYWDIERGRYPAYDHVAVLLAEEVTTRFLNVMEARERFSKFIHSTTRKMISRSLPFAARPVSRWSRPMLQKSGAFSNLLIEDWSN